MGTRRERLGRRRLSTAERQAANDRENRALAALESLMDDMGCGCEGGGDCGRDCGGEC